MKYECPECDAPNSSRMVACDVCRSWTHYGCTKLNSQEIKNIRNLAFTCTLCVPAVSNEGKEPQTVSTKENTKNRKALQNKILEGSDISSNRKRNKVGVGGAKINKKLVEKAVGGGNFDCEKISKDAKVDNLVDVIKNESTQGGGSFDIQTGCEVKLIDFVKCKAAPGVASHNSHEGGDSNVIDVIKGEVAEGGGSFCSKKGGDVSLIDISKSQAAQGDVSSNSQAGGDVGLINVVKGEVAEGGGSFCSKEGGDVGLNYVLKGEV